MGTLDTTNSLITATDMYSALGTTSAESSLVNDLINVASAAANTATCRLLKARTYTPPDPECYYDGEGGCELYLRQYPILAISSLYTDHARAFGSDTLVGASTYCVTGDRRAVFLDSGVLPSWPRSVRIQYTAGYAAGTPERAELQQAVKELVEFWYGRQSSHRVGKKSVSVEGESTTYETEMPATVKAVFERYRTKTV